MTAVEKAYQAEIRFIGGCSDIPSLRDRIAEYREEARAAIAKGQIEARLRLSDLLELAEERITELKAQKIRVEYEEQRAAEDARKRVQVEATRTAEREAARQQAIAAEKQAARDREAQRADADRAAAERAARLEQQRRKEADRLAREKKERAAAAEKERAAAEQRIAAERERARLAEEENRLLKQRLEADRKRIQLEAEQRRLQEAQRVEAERQKREAAERHKQAEQARIAAEKQEAERQARIAAEKQEAERQARIVAEKQEAERQRQEEVEARAAAEKQEAEQRAARQAGEEKEKRGVQTVEASQEPAPTDPATLEMPTTGPTLRAWRLQQKLSEAEAAEYLGVSRGAIYQNEKKEGSLWPKVRDAFHRKFGLLKAAPDAPQEPGPAYDILLGSVDPSPQYGILGEADGKLVAMDLNQTHTISLFGVQGGGKSYTLGTLMEMASMPIPRLNHLPNPAATLLFHYSATMDYAPEFTTMAEANTEAQQLQMLRERYGVEPQALEDLVLLVPADKLEERRLEYPMLEVRPLKFASSELQASHWRFLMGAVGNSSVYIQQINRIMKQMRNEITLEGLRKAITASSLSDQMKDLGNQRLDLAAEFIDDQNALGPLLHPGRLLIVDLRDEFLEKDQALGLFVVLMQIFSEVSFNGHSFNKLVVFDEAHKYVKNPELVSGLVESVREMRHKGTTILVASQDPPSVPPQLIELSSQVILHRFNSPAWLKHIQKANAALSALTPEQMANLQSGEAYVWSSKATEEGFSKGAKKLRCRPRVTQHGGGTKLAVRG